MNCQQCRKYVEPEQTIVGPNHEPFCSGECRNAWIWYSQKEPSPVVSEAMLYASRVAQTEHLRRIKQWQTVPVRKRP